MTIVPSARFTKYRSLLTNCEDDILPQRHVLQPRQIFDSGNSGQEICLCSHKLVQLGVFGNKQLFVEDIAYILDIAANLFEILQSDHTDLRDVCHSVHKRLKHLCSCSSLIPSGFGRFLRNLGIY